MKLNKAWLPALAPLLLVLSLASHAAINNRLGFRFHLDTTGMFRPTLERITVTAVRSRSPAAIAGLAVGDRIVEANGVAIAGAPVQRTSNMIGNAGPGEHFAFKVIRGNGFVLHVDIVAGPQ